MSFSSIKGRIKNYTYNYMPLTKSGKKVLAQMKKQYGPKKGKEVFYASIKSKKKGSEKWHVKRKKKSSSKTKSRMKGRIKKAVKEL